MSFNIIPKAAPESPAQPSGTRIQSQDAVRQSVIAKIEAIRKAESLETPEKKLVDTPVKAEATPENVPPTKEEESVAPPAKAEETPLSSQYAQLARKEKAIRAQALQVKAQNEALAAREAALKAKESEIQGDYIPKERLTQDTLKVLEEAGLSYEQITQMMLNAPSHEAQQQSAVIAKLEAKISALEEGQKKVTTTFEESQRNAYNQAVQQLKADAKKAVLTNPDYEMIKETNSIQDVVTLITETFENGLGAEYPKGTLLTVDEAAQMVEDHLYEETFKLTHLKKIQKRLAENAVATASQTPASKTAESTPGVKQVTMKTLTNRDGSARKLTASERAILAFKGELRQ